MDAKRADMKDGLAKEAGPPEVRWNFLHPGYRLEDGSRKWVRTGPLEILGIVCIDDERQFFRGRWDRCEEDRAKDALDFDLFLPDGTTSDDFKYGRGGWSGHHTTLESDRDTRTFKIEIKSPAGLICEGTASFTLAVQIVQSDAKAADFVDAEVVRSMPR
jgi:hypothetical protein